MKHRARMRRMRKDELEELLEEAKPEVVEQVAAKAEGPADKALELQKAAGNRAVGAALHRWSLPFVPQAETAQWPKAPEMLLDDEDAIPIESVQDAEAGRLPNRRRGEEEDEASRGGEFVISLKNGKWMIDLHQAVVTGKHYKQVEIVLPGKDGKGMRWILTDVYISGVQTSETAQTIQLSFKKREFSMAPPPRR
jgi:hypothetical protein